MLECDDRCFSTNSLLEGMSTVFYHSFTNISFFKKVRRTAQNETSIYSTWLQHDGSVDTLSTTYYRKIHAQGELYDHCIPRMTSVMRSFGLLRARDFSPYPCASYNSKPLEESSVWSTMTLEWLELV